VIGCGRRIGRARVQVDRAARTPLAPPEGGFERRHVGVAAQDDARTIREEIAGRLLPSVLPAPWYRSHVAIARRLL
jgi:hypothetical protein